MPDDPRMIHAFEQAAAMLNQLADVLPRYRQKLIDGGMPEAEAFEMVKRMELRLMGGVLEDLDQLQVDLRAAGLHLDGTPP